MNNVFERCRNCEVKCFLESRAQQIVDESGELTKVQIRHKISVLSLEANRNRCPNQEIGRVRKLSVESIGPKGFSSITGDFHGPISFTGEDMGPNYTFRLSAKEWRRREQFRDAKSKHRP